LRKRNEQLEKMNLELNGRASKLAGLVQDLKESELGIRLGHSIRMLSLLELILCINLLKL
jgi:hypothetical protein